MLSKPKLEPEIASYPTDLEVIFSVLVANFTVSDRPSDNSWTAEILQKFVPPLSVSETLINKQLFVSYYKFADVQSSDHS